MISRRSPRCATGHWCLAAGSSLPNFWAPIYPSKIYSPKPPPTSDIQQKRPPPSLSTGLGELMQSIKSNALEPTRSELATLTLWQAIGRMAPVYGLPLLTLVLIVLFSILLPDTFPTW